MPRQTGRGNLTPNYSYASYPLGAQNLPECALFSTDFFTKGVSKIPVHHGPILNLS